MDLYADPEKFGKQVGGDVLANKKTLLYLIAANKATLEQKEIMKQLHNAENPVLKINRTRELFDHLDIPRECEEMMQDYYDRAMKSLNAINVDSDHKKALISLAAFLIQRDN